MLDEAEYLRWMETSKRTLSSAEGDLERGDFNWACFKAQQAGEYAVKALLHGLGLPAYGHSISKILSELSAEKVSVPQEISSAALTLDKLYVPTRYPNAWAEGAPHEFYSREDAVEALECSRKIIDWVEELWKCLKRERS